MTHPGKTKAFLLSICLSLLAVLLCFFVIEVYLRIQYNNEQALVAPNSLCTTVSEHSELIYTRKPGKCGSNSHGFRDNEYAYDKSEQVKRIVVIGDSIAAGLGVNFRDSFGNQLESKLNTALNGAEQKIEVIVLAQAGYSTSQELFLLEHEAFKYSPDLIVWSYVLNDPAHPVYHNENGGLGRYYFEPRVHTAHFISEKLFAIFENWKASSCESDFHALIHCVYWDQVVSNVKKISQLAQQHGVPVVFLIHPILEENGNFADYPLSLLHTKLAVAAADAGLPVIDLLDAYRPYKTDDLDLSRTRGHDLWHPNEKGHEIVADVLLNYMNAKLGMQKWVEGER
jgi:lysophospholipase L1-like esterase